MTPDDSRNDPEEHLGRTNRLGVVWDRSLGCPRGSRGNRCGGTRIRLQADGWKGFRERKDLIPADALRFHQENAADPSVIGFTTDEIEFRKGKWWLSIEHKTTFDKGRPPHARFCMRLTWHY